MAMGAGLEAPFRIGIGPSSGCAAARWAKRLAPKSPIAIVGLAGGLDPDLAPGDLVVASEVLGPQGAIAMTGAHLISAELRRMGLAAHVGKVLSRPRPVFGRARNQAASQASVVDMETAWALPMLGARPLVVVRAVADTGGAGPLRIAAGTMAALDSLAKASRTLAQWAAACGPGDIVVASPEESTSLVGMATVLALGLGRNLKDEPAFPSGPVHYLAHPTDLRLGWLAGKGSVGIMAEEPTSAEVAELVAWLSWLGRQAVDGTGARGVLANTTEVS